MSAKLITRIAFRLLRARLRQTVVAAVGVTFGIAMFISLLSFMAGLNQLLDDLILNRTPHIRLFNEAQPSNPQPVQRTATYKDHYHIIHSVKPEHTHTEIHNSEAIRKAVLNDKRVLGLAPKVTTPVFYNAGGINLNGAISGIDVAAENRLFTFSNYIIEGNYLDLKNIPNSIILGKGAASRMMARNGDIIYVTTPGGGRFPLRVAGIFQSGIEEIDKVQSYVSLSTAQKLMGRPDNYITDLQIKLKDMAMAPAMAKEYSARFGTQAIDIQTANAQFETGSSVRTLISYAVGITLLIVAGFGIYNILNMMIYEKMESIAILKATGFSGRDVNRIFITIALGIGISGGLMGLLSGMSITALIHLIPFTSAAMPDVKTYPVTYDPQFYITGMIFATATTYAAGFFPARKASRVDPVVIIRGK
jgi:lipoprotein-releasing system permease protein